MQTLVTRKETKERNCPQLSKEWEPRGTNIFRHLLVDHCRSLCYMRLYASVAKVDVTFSVAKFGLIFTVVQFGDLENISFVIDKTIPVCQFCSQGGTSY